MKTSSAKAKGRRLAAELKRLILDNFPLQDEDVLVTPSGVTGEDLSLSPAARAILPYTHECKNQESISIWEAIHQSESHVKGRPYTPLLYFRRNNHPVMVCLRAEHFMEILKRAHR